MTALSLLLISPTLFAQVSTSQSLGDLARKAREAREKHADANTTFTNDSRLPEKPVPEKPVAPNPVVKASGPYELNLVPKEWSSCAAALAEITNSNPGHTDQHVDVKYSGNTFQSNGLWTFAGTTAVQNSITMTLPDWVNMPAAPSIRAAWNKMIADLRKHEEGHVNIDMEAVQQLTGKTITGSGPTQAAAQQDAQRQFNQLMQTVDTANRAKQEQYDAVTNHGRKQSAVGGTDVAFSCP